MIQKRSAMARFIVRHQHDADRCPAADPYSGAKLLNYLSRPSVRQHGIEIHGEAVVRGEHTLYMIVECDDEDHLRRFMQPFAEAGSVDIFPASTCAGVMASSGCAAPPPSDDELDFAHDPADACQRAIEAGLV